MKTTKRKPLVLLLTLALLLSLLPAAASAEGSSVTPQIAYGTVGNGYYAIVVLKSDGTLWQYISANGDFTTTVPQKVLDSNGSVFSGVTAVTGNDAGFIALKSDGTVWAWGMQENCLLGNASVNTVPYPVQVPDTGDLTGYLTGVTAVSAGIGDSRYFLAMKSGGTVWSWGAASNGQLGTGPASDTKPVTQVWGEGGSGTTLQNVTAISAGCETSMALKSDGTVSTWGRNNGNLGNGGTSLSNYPVRVLKGTSSSTTDYLENVTAIAAGGNAMLALKGDGTLWSWGSNFAGSVGNNETFDTVGHSVTTPVQVLGEGGSGVLTGVTAVYADKNISMAVKDGRLYAWGTGSIGNGTTASYAPVRVLGAGGTGELSGVTDLAGAAFALMDDGTVNGWGQANSSSYPIRMPGSAAAIGTAAALTEQSIGGATVTLELLNNCWSTTPAVADFTPSAAGVSVAGVAKTGSDTCVLTLANTGNITAGTLSFSVAASALKYGNTTASNALPVTLVDESAALASSPSPLAEQNLNGAQLTVTLTNSQFKSSSLNKSLFTLNNAPAGVSIASAAYVSGTEYRLTLAYDGTNMASDAAISVTVSSGAVTNGGALTTGSLTITKLNKTAALTSSPSPLTEQNLDGAALTVTLTGCLFKSNSLNKTVFTLNNAPAGVSIASAAYVSSAEYRLTLAYDGTYFTGSIANLSVGIAASAVDKGVALTTSSLTVTGTAAPMIASPDTTLTESNLNGRLLYVVLGTDTFADATLNKANFTLENAPDGVSISSVIYINATQCVVGLSYDGRDFAVNYTRFHLVIAGAELSGGSALASQNLPITADTIPPSISPASRNYDLNAPADVSTAITWSSALRVTDVVYGSDHLTTLGAFTVSGNILTVKDSYLSGLALSEGATLEFTITFNTGATASLTVNAVDNYTPPSISPASRNYALNAPADVTTAITWNSALTVTDVVYGSNHLTTPNAFTVSGNILTIKDSYLSGLTLAEGATLEFTITFDAGATASLTVNVVDNYTPSNDAALSDIKVGGITVSGFNSSVTSYNVELPYGTLPGSAAAIVSATPDEPHAQVNITQVSAIPGSATVAVTAEDNATIKTYTINFTMGAEPSVTTCTVTFNSDGSAYATKTVQAGANIGISAWPANPTKSGYTFGGWFTGANGSGSEFTLATPVNATMTVYAKWTSNGGGGGGGGGGSSTPSTPGTKNYTANIKVTDTAGNGTKETTLPVTVDTDTGRATVDLSSQNNLITGGRTSVIALPSIPDVNTYTLGIPVSYLSTPDKQGALTVHNDIGSITIPSNMMAGVAGASGNKAEISIGQGDKSGLPEAAKAAVGDRPLIQLSVSIDGKQTEWNNPDAPVTVTIPYMPTAEELANPESIVVWYIDGNGKAVSVPNGHYDPATGALTFATTHFSHYAVGYSKVSFNDVAAGEWYNKAVSFIAARGITTGTGNGNYSPESKLTRGEFIVMMMRAYGIEPDINPKDNFADAGSTWYTGYLSTAKRLDISGGVGNNMFEPGQEITRQEMFTLLYNALNVISSLPKGTYGKALSDFSDANEIASWAKDAMTLMVGTGTISGNGGKLSPASTTTRAEMAQVLHNLLSK